MTRRFLLFVLFFSFLKSNAQDFWQQTNGPYGGHVYSLASNAGGHIFAGTLSGAVFRSTDDGASWTPINIGLTAYAVYSLAINANGHIFAGTGSGGVFRSTDNGASWSAVNTGLTDGYVGSLAINASGHIFAGTRGSGVFRSTDNGASWTNTGLTENVSSLAINASGHIFAGTQFFSGVFRSTDNGASWTNTGLTNGSVQSLAINAGGDVFAGTTGGVFRSTDNGSNWTPTGLTTYSVQSLAINADGHVFAGTGDGGGGGQVFRSTDNGASWTNTGLTTYYIQSLAINADGHIFAGTGGSGVFRSTDNGASWNAVNTGLPISTVQSLAINASGHIFAGTEGSGVFRSTDNGDNWIGIGLNTNTVYSLAINSSGHVFAGTWGSGVFRSMDNGTSWSAVNSGLTNGYIRSLATNAGGDVFAGTNGGVFRSTDNGTNWSAVNSGLTNGYVYSLAINSSGHVFAGTWGSGVFRSMDNGTNWSAVNSGLTTYVYVQSLAINAGGDVFAGTTGGVFRSTDNGANWSPINTGLTNYSVSALAINAGGDVFAGTTGGVFRSTDNGSNWTPTGLTTYYVPSLVINSSGDVFAGTWGGGVFVGNSCARIFGPLELFVDDFQCGVSPLWSTTIGGCTWNVSGGTYTASLAGNQVGCVQSVSGADWRNYVFEYQVRGNAGVDKIVRFRQKDPDTYYFLNVRSDWQGNDEVILAKQALGTETILQTVSYPSQNGTWYSMKITCVDEHITVSIDGNKVIDFDDQTNPIYSGGIGIACFTGGAGVCDISFDNVRVTDPFPHIVINEPGTNFFVGAHVTLMGRVQYRDGTSYVPASGNIGVEDPVSARSANVPVASNGTFNYTTVNPANQSGMWMFIFGSNTGEGVVRQAYNLPVSRSIPTQTLKSSRTFQAPTGLLNRPLQKTADAFSGRRPVEPFKAAGSALRDATKAMWASLKADAVTSWKRTIGSGVNRQMLQNAEMFAQKCNPLNPLDGNCANMVASYGYLFTTTLRNVGWAKAQKGIDLLHQFGWIDDCQYSQATAALSASEVIVAFAGFDYGKAVDAVETMAAGADFGDVIEDIENSYQTCVSPLSSATTNPYPFAAATFDPSFGDILLIGLIPKIPRAVVINGYSPIEITVVDPQGRYVSKDSSNIPGAEYMLLDTDLDGDSEQVVIVPLDTTGDVQVSVAPAPGASPTDTFSVTANYTYYETPQVLASGMQISEIPPAPYTVAAFENLPPDSFDLTIPNDTSILGFPVSLSWQQTADPNPGHTVEYSVVISRSPTFADSAIVPVDGSTSYQFNDDVWASSKVATLDTARFFWKVLAYDAWGATTSSAPRSFKVEFRRGDINQDGNLAPSDVVLELNCVFLGTGSCPLALTDGNCDGNLSPADVVLELNAVFLGAAFPC